MRKAHYRKTVETKGHQDRSEERVGGGGREEGGDGGEKDTLKGKHIWGEDSESSFSVGCKLGPVSR